MTYRQISTGNMKPAAVADQALPILQWVDLDQLVIDDRYQRPLERRNMQAIQKIADEFDWMQFSPVLIAPADGGRFAVIDGQHRAHAAALCGIARIPAQIVLATAAQQARAFAGVNSKVVQINGHQVYRAALLAGEPWAERCCSVVESAGVHLATHKPTSKARLPRVLYQIGQVRRMVCDRGQSEALKAVLRGLVEYDANNRVALFSDYIVAPMVEAVHSNAEFVSADLAAFLRAHDPFKVLDRAARLRMDGNNVSDMQALKSVLAAWVANG